MKRILIYFLLVVLGVGIGLGYAQYQLNYWTKNQYFPIKNKQWRTVPSLGKDVGIIDRARTAVSGLFALDRKEAMYFVTAEDTEGNPLTTDKAYIIKGKEMSVRYWGITLYDSEYMLIPSEYEKYALSNSNLIFGKDRKFEILLSSKEEKGNWLPTGTKKQRFYVALRLYNPSQEMIDNLETIELPTVEEIKN